MFLATLRRSYKELPALLESIQLFRAISPTKLGKSVYTLSAASEGSREGSEHQPLRVNRT